jgi:hypothetical protein
MPAIRGSWKNVPTSPFPQLRAYQVEYRKTFRHQKGYTPYARLSVLLEDPSPNAELTCLPISSLTKFQLSSHTAIYLRSNPRRKKYREQTDIHISEVITKFSYRLQDRVLESVQPAVVYIYFDIPCWRQVWLCNFPEQQLSWRASLGHSFSRKQ